MRSPQSSRRAVGFDRAPLHRLEENLGAATLQLGVDVLTEITAAAEAIAIKGARYPDALEARTGL